MESVTDVAPELVTVQVAVDPGTGQHTDLLFPQETRVAWWAEGSHAGAVMFARDCPRGRFSQGKSCSSIECGRGMGLETGSPCVSLHIRPSMV